MDDWIPIASALPSLEDGFVLIVINFHEPHVRRAIRLGYHDPMSDHWVTQMGRIKSHWEVTHWQPLPDLPEVEA